MRKREINNDENKKCNQEEKRCVRKDRNKRGQKKREGESDKDRTKEVYNQKEKESQIRTGTREVISKKRRRFRSGQRPEKLIQTETTDKTKMRKKG